MTTDVLHVEFNGRREPLNSVLADIKPDLYTMKEALEMVASTITAYDEADCRGPVSCDSGPQTIPDGRIGGDKIGVKLSGRGMNNELNRLETFKGWPGDSPVSASHLARAGFYYSGLRDAVKCFSCGGQVEGWECGDTAMGEHKRLFPNCEFANNRTTTNVALLETKERPEFAQKLSSKIEQSQREIERRAKEKEAMIEGYEPSETKKDFTASSASSSSSSAWDEEMEEEEEPSMLFGRYNQEHVRLQSFKNWPRTCPIEPRDLAKAGFYYLNEGDSVQCFACFGQISRWKPCDVPDVEHKTHFPNCPFVQGLDVENKPISTPPVMGYAGMPPPSRSYSSPSPTPDQLRAGQMLQQQRNLRAQMGPLNNCKHPDYVQESARLLTFRRWSGNPGIHVTPKVLAKAGFYFTGIADECKCFYCNGGLKNWEPTDEPWTEHAKWFPRCEWLIQQRGHSFISHVQQVNPPPISSPPLNFTSPTFGTEEPYSQVEPYHSFQATYQERHPQASSSRSSSPPLNRSTKEMTIEEEKAAAHREFMARHQAEPEAAAVVNFSRPKPNKLEAAEPSALKSKLGEEQGSATSSIDDFLQSDIAQLAVEMGYHHDLIRYVVTQRFKKTGRLFTTLDELLDSIWEAQGQGVDPTLSVVKAMGDQDAQYLKKPPKAMDSQSASAMCSSFLGFQTENVAGRSIQDQLRKKMNPPSSTVPQIREGYGEGFLTPTVSQNYQGEEEQDDREEDIRQTLAFSEDLQSDMSQMTDEMWFALQRCQKTDLLLSTTSELTESILDVQGQSNNPTPSGLQAMGGQDVPSTSGISPSIEDTSIRQILVTENVAGHSIQDQLRKKMKPPSSTVPQIREGYGEGYLTPTDSQDYQVGEEEDDREEDIRQTIAVSSGSSDPYKLLCRICLDKEFAQSSCPVNI